eukprot:g8391.t1
MELLASVFRAPLVSYFPHEEWILVQEWIQELVTITGLFLSQYWRICTRSLDEYYQRTMQQRKISSPVTKRHINQFSAEDIETLNQFRTTSCAVDAIIQNQHQSQIDQIANSIPDAIPDHYLLQFAALNGDSSARQCLERLDPVYGLGKKTSLFGVAEQVDSMDQSWERRVQKRRPGLGFTMERKPWRSGLYLYRTRAIFDNCKAEDLKNFILSPSERLRWDWSIEKLMEIPDQLSILSKNSDSCFVFSEHKMPCPFANREYLLARRLWGEKDGGRFYCISTSSTHEEAPKRRGRNVRVEDYASGFLIKQVPGTQTVEMESVYFDDMKLKAMAMNLAMSASMWTAISATETAFRKFQSSDRFKYKEDGHNDEEETKNDNEMQLRADDVQYEKQKIKGRRLWLTLGLTALGFMVLKQKKHQNSVQFNENEICINGSSSLSAAVRRRMRSSNDSFPII